MPDARTAPSSVQPPIRLRPGAAICSRHDNCAFVFQAQRDKCLSLGLRQGRLLDLLTLAIEAVELGSDTRRFNGVFFQQQSHAEVGPANASARIDPRAKQKS